MQRPDQSSNSKKILRITIPLFVLFALILAYYKLQPAPDCRVRPSEQINIVFDKTKGYSETQAHSVDRTVVELLTRAADNAEINLYYVTRRGDQPHLVLNECRPFTRTNALVGDPEQQQRTFRRLVIKKVKEVIDLRFGAAAPAPIIESLATISRQRIVTAKLEQQTPVEFDIYSDMLQESPNASLALPPRNGGSAPVNTDPKRCTSTAAARSPEFKGLYTDVKQLFRDVPVHVYALHRDVSPWPRYPGEQCVRVFWEETFPHLTWITI
jgi:hypothetical protein